MCLQLETVKFIFLFILIFYMENLVKQIKEGKVFIYPTDTVYGLGCDATNDESVRRIRDIKKSEKPFSVIASKEWIKKNCIIKKEYLDKLPGAYTFIVKMKKQCVSKEVSEGTLGVRIPDCEFTDIILESERPFVSTSVNLTGEDNLVDVKDLKKDIKDKVDVVVDVGKLENKPSKVIGLNGEVLRE